MHILLEVLPYTMNLMLNSFTFSRSEARDKPRPFLIRNFQPDGKIHQEGNNTETKVL